MASNVSGIAITIRAFLPTGKTLDEQFEALSLVKDAHKSGDYCELLKAAKIDEVKTEQKVRRIEDSPLPVSDGTSGYQPTETEISAGTTSGETGSDLPDDWLPDNPTSENPDEYVPEFLKGKRKTAA